MEPFLEPLESYSQKYPQNLSKTQVELFSVNIKLLLRGSILGSNFYIFEKFRLSAFTGKKINVIAILENFLSSREFTYCENLIFGALELHFQAQKSKCPITFLKISVRALHFWIKR
tara:strand:+ start:234 stop:581 length:348 start_codon:yes stop_codon:yes gene_type:complete